MNTFQNDDTAREFTRETMDETDVQDLIETLPGIGYFDDDIKAQLKETVKSISQDIVDLLGSQYSEARTPSTLPANFWKPIRSKAYEITAEHCTLMAQELVEASKDPCTEL